MPVLERNAPRRQGFEIPFEINEGLEGQNRERTYCFSYVQYGRPDYCRSAR
jgi:hypothetical protein